MGMTDEQQRLADDKMRAEIAKLFAEQRRLNSEVDEKMRAEIAKLLAETRHVNVTTFLAPALAAAGLMAATAALVKLFFT